MNGFVIHRRAKIFYSDRGTGPSLVFLHGFLESSSMWSRLADDLLGKYRVICIDLPGHGKSECLGYVHKMSDMAQVVKSVISHLKLDSFILTGHSMGGYVSLAYAEKYPEDLKAICLMNSTAAADSEEKKTNRDRAIAAVKENKNRFIKMSIPNLFRPKNKNQYEQEIKYLIQEAFLMDARGIIAALEGMKIRKNKEEVIKKFGKKCLLVIGKNDPVLPIESLLSQLKKYDLSGVILEDGHMSHIEEYESFSYNFMQFIEYL